MRQEGLVVQGAHEIVELWTAGGAIARVKAAGRGVIVISRGQRPVRATYHPICYSIDIDNILLILYTDYTEYTVCHYVYLVSGVANRSKELVAEVDRLPNARLATLGFSK